MTEFKPNSHKSKEVHEEKVVEKKKIEKVTKGSVKTKKKSGVNKVADIFLADDLTNVKNYIIEEVLIPEAKKAIADIVKTSIDMLIYGEVRSNKREKGSKVSYDKYYERDRDRGRERDYERGRRRVTRGYDFEDITLETRGEAEDVLDRMDDLLDTYGVVSVADLYDLVGKDGVHTDNKYGWSSLRNADVQRTRDGYLLKLPKALPLDQ